MCLPTAMLSMDTTIASYQKALEEGIRAQDWAKVRSIKNEMDDIFESGEIWYEPASKISASYNNQAFLAAKIGIVLALFSSWCIKSKNHQPNASLVSRITGNPKKTFVNGLVALCAHTTCYSIWKGNKEVQKIHSAFDEQKRIFRETVSPIMGEIIYHKHASNKQ